MKDLKHLIYFEGLLESANNELVQQAQKDGKLAMGLGSANYICPTSSASAVDKDEILLYGPDLKEIRGNTVFARIVFIRVGVMDGDDEEIYRALKDIEFCKYHVYPEGYMRRRISLSMCWMGMSRYFTILSLPAISSISASSMTSG